MSTKLIGVEKLQAKCELMKVKVKDAIADAATDIGREIFNDIKQNIWRDEGILEKGLRFYKATSSKDAKIVATKNWQVVHLHEFGTSRMEARPVIRPATDKQRSNFVNRVNNKLSGLP